MRFSLYSELQLHPGKTAESVLTCAISAAQALRLRARLAARRDDDETERLFKQAAGRFKELGVLFYLGVTLLDHGEWLAARGRSDATAYLEEARRLSAGLEAAPWLERSARLLAGTTAS